MTELLNRNDIVKCSEQINLIVISTVGRAGSMLLQSLFDKHPSVVVIPEVAQKYEYIRTFSQVGCDIDKWLDAHPEFYSGFDPANSEFNDKIDAYFIGNRSRFVSVFCYIASSLGGVRSLNSKKLILSLSLSLAVIYGKSLCDLKYIVFHHHNNRVISDDISLILNDFPLLKVLVAIRHPIENALSFQTLEIRTGDNTFRKLSRNTRGWSVKSWRNLQNLADKIESKDNFKLLDLNALHLDPDKVLCNVAKWLGIKNSNLLKLPSISGVAWLGNSADGKPIEAFEKQRSKLLYPATIGKSGGLSTEEYLFVEYFCRDTVGKLGYENKVEMRAVNFAGFLFILIKKIKFFDSNVIPHDRGFRKLIRKFGYSEVLLVVIEVLKMKLAPIKPLKGSRIDLDEIET